MDVAETMGSDVIPGLVGSVEALSQAWAQKVAADCRLHWKNTQQKSAPKGHVHLLDLALFQAGSLGSEHG